MTTISRDEWLKALGDAATPNDPDALTVQELCAQFNASLSQMQRRVKALVGQGKARRTFKVFNGRRMPAYVLVTPAKKRP